VIALALALSFETSKIRIDPISALYIHKLDKKGHLFTEMSIMKLLWHRGSVIQQQILFNKVHPLRYLTLYRYGNMNTTLTHLEKGWIFLNKGRRHSTWTSTLSLTHSLTSFESPRIWTFLSDHLLTRKSNAHEARIFSFIFVRRPKMYRTMKNDSSRCEATHSPHIWVDVSSWAHWNNPNGFLPVNRG